MRKSSFVLALAFVLAPLCSAQTAQPAAAKRPMTFEDMMQMKRLGETAVSADGKWLAYSVTTVNLDKNTKTAELWLQAIAGGDPMKLAVALPGDSGVQFAPDGKRILFLSGRVGSEQIWLADFDGATGATSNAKKLTNILRLTLAMPSGRLTGTPFSLLPQSFRIARRSRQRTMVSATSATPIMMKLWP
jgi:hypothetical protein